MKKLILSLLLLTSFTAFGQTLPNIWVPTSGTNTYTTNITNFGSSYSNKIAYVKFGNTNTGASTLQINSIISPPALRMWDGDSWEPLTASQIDVNTVYKVAYNGSYWQMESFGTGGGGGGGTWGSITGTLSDQTDLQTALDGKVNDTGNETIAGTKTFSSTIVGSINGNAATVTTNANLTGDVTSSGNATTLATVNGNVGTFGSATQSTQITANAKGLITAIANVTITPAVGSITGFATNVPAFLTTPSSANLAAAVTDELGTGLLPFSEQPSTTQTGTTYTLQTTDRGSIIRFTNAGSITLTIPTNASQAIQVGTTIWIKGINCGVMTLSVAGITYTTTSGNLLSPAAAGGSFTMVLTKRATDTWDIDNGPANFVSGNGVTPNGNKFDLGALTSAVNLSGGFGIGINVSPTAMLTLPAGTASSGTAPLKFTSGTNLTTPEAGTLEYNGTVLQFTPGASRYNVMVGLSGSVTQDVASVPAQTTSSPSTITVTGAAVGDPVYVGVSAITAGTIFTAQVTASNTVTVYITNPTGGALDPPNATYSVRVIKTP